MNESYFYVHRFLLRAGLAIANVFAWIFIFEYFYLLSGNAARAVAGTVLLYGFAQFITLVATPVSAARLRRGTKHSLIWGVVLASAAFVVLGGTFAGYFSSIPSSETSTQTGAVLAWGVVAFAVLFGLYRALYWIPYMLLKTQVGLKLSMRSYLEIVLSLLPLFAGFTLVAVPSAPLRLLFGSAALIGLSAFPAMLLSDTRERFSWSYFYTMKQLWQRRNRGLVLQSICEGLQGAALFLVWPLAIFIIVGRSYLLLGFVFSATLLLILLLRRAYKWLFKTGRLESSMVHVVIIVSSWVARLAAGTPLSIIVADVYSYTTLPDRGTHFDPFSYEHASDRGAFVDEYTALKEMGLAVGRVMLSITIFFLALAFALPLVFAIALLIAAVASGVSTLVARRATATY